MLEIHTDDFFKDTAGDVEEWFDTSGYPKDHFAVKNGFPVGKNKKKCWGCSKMKLEEKSFVNLLD